MLEHALRVCILGVVVLPHLLAVDGVQHVLLRLDLPTLHIAGDEMAANHRVLRNTV